MKKYQAFTLMEMMIVLVIIGLLAVFVLPAPQENHLRKQIAESLDLIENYKHQISLSYQAQLVFPKNNADAKLPKAEHLMGNFVQKIELDQGAFHLYFGNKAHTMIKDKIVTVRPIVVKASPESPISWICGYSPVPEGMMAIGDNLTNVEKKHLPLNCR